MVQYVGVLLFPTDMASDDNGVDWQGSQSCGRDAWQRKR